MSGAETLERDFGAEQIADGLTVRERNVGANVTSIAALKAGCAAGLGDGRVVSIDASGLSERHVHTGAVTAMAVAEDGAIISAGQDGRLMSLDAHGEAAQLHDAKNEWITAARHHGPTGLTAVAYSKTLVVIGPAGTIGRFSDHPSAISDIAFSPSGDRIAACRYDGVTIWSTRDAAEPANLYWKGSAVAVSWSPDGRYIAAATQDRELHVWDLAADKDYRLGGFKTKPRHIAWSDDSAYLLSSGADVIAAWPIAGGPGAFPPVEIGYVAGATVSAVAGGSKEQLAGGFSNGAILVGNAKNGEALIARSGAGSEITRLTWDDRKKHLYFGARDGALGLVLMK